MKKRGISYVLPALMMFLMFTVTAASANSSYNAILNPLTSAMSNLLNADTSEMRIANRIELPYGCYYISQEDLDVLLQSPDPIQMTFDEDYGIDSDMLTDVTGIQSRYARYNPGDESGKMITDVSWGHLRSKSQENWDAYEAGERAQIGILELFMAAPVLSASGRAPIDPTIFNALTSSYSNMCSLIGLDSAYMNGTAMLNNSNTIRWEVWPFYIVDSDEAIHENTFYIYFRTVEEAGELEEEVTEYYIANRNDVCNLFERMLDINLNIKKEDRIWMQWYIDLANFSSDPNKIDAIYNTGISCLTGNGCNINYPMAKMHLMEAASFGHHGALYVLGIMYEEGIGVTYDLEKAIEWYAKSAEKGNLFAMEHLGWIYIDQEDYQKGIDLLLASAEGGNIDAMKDMAVLYYKGIGVDIDIAKAKKWYWRAWENGDQDAYMQYLVLNNGSSRPPQ